MKKGHVPIFIFSGKAMKEFRSPFYELGEIQELKEKLNKGGMYELSGILDQAKAQAVQALGWDVPWKLVIIDGEKKALEFVDEYRHVDENTEYFPAKDVLFYQSDVKGNTLTRERMRVFRALSESDHLTIATTVDALMNILPPLEELTDAVIELHPGDEEDPSRLQRKLVAMGYEPVAQVEEPGQFASRGGIIDVFSLTEDAPVRIEFWDTEIDTIRTFDIGSQKSDENVDCARIDPAMEFVLTDDKKQKGLKQLEKEYNTRHQKLRDEMKTEEAFALKTMYEDFRDLAMSGDYSQADGFQMYFEDEQAGLLDYIPQNGLIFIDEPARIAEQAGMVEKEVSESMMRRVESGSALPGQQHILFGSHEILGKCANRTGVMFAQIAGNTGAMKPAGQYYVHQVSVTSYQNSTDLLEKEIGLYRKKKYRICLITSSETRGRKLADNLVQDGLNVFYSDKGESAILPGQVMVTRGFIRRGYEFPDIAFVYITEGDIFGTATRRKKKRKRHTAGTAIQSFGELSPGDYVVHENHGLGIYEGIKKIEVDGVVKDYLKISYAGDSNLYVPVTNLDVLSKYGSVGDKKPKLNSLNDNSWSKTKSRVKSAVGEVAKELVDLYAQRQQNKGYVYGPDTPWQKEFEDSFPYEETDSQMQAIEDVKADMESPKIMDRLICGDVGFGKTEIAMRAAFKSVQENKQVAYLVPTTILCQQHYNNFKERMKNYPVNIEMLSRFRTAAQNKETIQRLKEGRVDIVIGTHRLLSKDVGFKDLGLLIIDEEQRFGVTHKEKIKEMKKNVDVMSLSATPIPRTLHMSMSGIRDMSLLLDAPTDRVPIQTFVFEQNDEMVREAIERELARGGQVYYVINKVRQIADVAAKIQDMVPDAVVEYAHGQMPKNQLEEIMTDFVNRDIDVLVATTIIEIGLDISNVNTIIIHDADQLGLSQLYQLRGRVGRSSRTAYAFLMYRRDKVLKEVAEKRLAAIREFTDLGSGYKIAMRDLEIRGAGNILGEEQSGHMASVGYELYCKLLNAAVAKEKGLPASEDEFETNVDIRLDAYIPSSYIRDDEIRLDMYKRISAIGSEDDKQELLEELIDRFGDPGKAVMNLLDAALLRNTAHRAYITKIKQTNEKVTLSFWEKARIDGARIPEVLEAFSPYLTFVLSRLELVLDMGLNKKFPRKDFMSYLIAICEKICTIGLPDEEKNEQA